MITYNGFRKKKCFLEGNNVVIDGESYSINSIKETDKFKKRTNFILVVMVIYTVYILYAVYMGFQEQVFRNPDSTDRLVNAGFLLFALSLFLILWVVIIKYGLILCINCRSYWLVNGKGLYVENNDDLINEATLREIKHKIAYGNHEVSKSDETMTNKAVIEKIETLLWSFAHISFFGLLFLGFNGYIKEDIAIPLIISVVVLIFTLRFYQIKTDFDTLKWKK